MTRTLKEIREARDKRGFEMLDKRNAGFTLKSIGKDYGISGERARQVIKLFRRKSLKETKG